MKIVIFRGGKDRISGPDPFNVGIAIALGNTYPLYGQQRGDGSDDQVNLINCYHLLVVRSHLFRVTVII